MFNLLLFSVIQKLKKIKKTVFVVIRTVYLNYQTFAHWKNIKHQLYLLKKSKANIHFYNEM